MREERYKVLQLPQQVLVDVWNWWRDPQCFLSIPELPEMPADVEVVSVQLNQKCRAIELLVWHASFDVVPPLMRPPVLSSHEVTVRRVPFGERLAQ